MINNTDDIIGIDYGAKRIGIARISPIAKIGQPIITIDATTDTLGQIQEIVDEYQAQVCVVGLPRGLDGQETDQTRECIDFASQLKKHISVPVYMIDEAGSSVAAQKRITDTGSSAGIDAMAAAIFVEDFVNHSNTESLIVQ